MERFKQLLDSKYKWPCLYTFKFIVKKNSLNELIKLIKSAEISNKKSSRGNYISVTGRKKFYSSNEVVSFYKTVSSIEGIISL